MSLLTFIKCRFYFRHFHEKPIFFLCILLNFFSVFPLFFVLYPVVLSLVALSLVALSLCHPERSEGSLSFPSS